MNSKYSNEHPSEGVVIRVDHNGISNWYKHKSYGFRLLEGIVRDTTVDIEEIS